VSASSVDHGYQMVDWVYDNPRAMVAVVVPYKHVCALARAPGADWSVSPAQSDDAVTEPEDGVMVLGRQFSALARAFEYQRTVVPAILLVASSSLSAGEAPGFCEGAKNLVDAVFRQFTQ